MPGAAVTQLVERLAKQKDVVVEMRAVENANHFFADKLDLLEGEVTKYLDERQA